LRDIIFFLENADIGLSEYRQKAQAAGIIPVVIQDKENLKKYLTGVIDTCEQIDLQAAAHGENIITEVPTPQVLEQRPSMSKEEMEEQRKRYGAFINCLIGESPLNVNENLMLRYDITHYRLAFFD